MWDLGGASDFVLCFGFGVVLGGALCLGLCSGLLYLSWEVLCVLRVWCWVGRCFVIFVV